MRIARVSSDAGPRYGIVDDEHLVMLAGDPLVAGYEPTGDRLPLAGAKLLSPIIPRSKIVAVGRNYAKHAAEFGNEVPAEPLLFFKPNTAVVGPDDVVTIPSITQDFQFEGELAVIIGRVARRLSARDALDVVVGYTCANDLTLRDLQRSDGQWARAKGFDGSCPLGPWIETEFEVGSQRLTTHVNGEVRQDAPLSDMVHSVAAIIAHITQAITLLPGDVILTGTPEGVGPLVPGDVVDVTIEGIGTLRTGVAAPA